MKFLSIRYLYSKFFKKILRGTSILHSNIAKSAYISSGCNIVYSSFGNYSYCGYDCEIYNCDIGHFCSISDHVFIGGAEHPISWISTSPVFQDVKNSAPFFNFSKHPIPKSKKTIIGHDVWIGHGVSIKQGVKIGNGAVIATGAIVTKDVEPYAIVGGCPAKCIKYRFQPDIILQLQTTEWWNLPFDKLKIVSKYIKEPYKFLNELKNVSI